MLSEPLGCHRLHLKAGELFEEIFDPLHHTGLTWVWAFPAQLCDQNNFQGIFLDNNKTKRILLTFSCTIMNLRWPFVAYSCIIIALTLIFLAYSCTILNQTWTFRAFCCKIMRLTGTSRALPCIVIIRRELSEENNEWQTRPDEKQERTSTQVQIEPCWTNQHNQKSTSLR